MRSRGHGSFVVAAAFVALLLGSVQAVLGAQQCGDVTDDGEVTATDALQVLRAAVGLDVTLICEGDCQELLARVEALEALLANVSVEGHNLVLTGMNLQVVSGSGSTDGKINGTGNIIIGYDEDNHDDKTGSHNLVIGMDHTYTSFGGVVAGNNNEVDAPGASILGGTENVADGSYTSILGGTGGRAAGDTSTISGGEDNLTIGVSSVVSGGAGNYASGHSAAVAGGFSNTAGGLASTLGGGRSRTVGSAFDWQAGGLFQAE